MEKSYTKEAFIADCTDEIGKGFLPTFAANILWECYQNYLSRNKDNYASYMLWQMIKDIKHTFEYHKS